MNPCIPHLKWHRAPQLYQLLFEKSEVSIMLCCQLCSTRYTVLQTKNCLKSTSAIHAYRKKWHCALSYINYRLKSEVSSTLRCRPCSTRYTVVQITNCSKSISAIKIATMKNTDDFHYEGKPSRATAKSTLFAVSKEEWDTKEDTGKSMKNALYSTYCGMPKGTCRAKAN